MVETTGLNNTALQLLLDATEKDIESFCEKTTDSGIIAQRKRAQAQLLRLDSVFDGHQKTSIDGVSQTRDEYHSERMSIIAEIATKRVWV